MKVPLLDLKAQLDSIKTPIKEAVASVIESCHYIMGPVVEYLEQKIAEYVGAKFAIGVSSGTDALLVCLMAIDLKPQNLVITTPYSFFATAGAVTRLGATPVFVDIDPQTYNLCPIKLREWFKNNADKIPNVKAIIPVHLFGQCADMDPIMDLANEHKIPVIEDGAQAIGASYPSKSGLKYAGQIADLACFSFFPSKNLGGIGDGGMVTTDNQELAEKIKKLRNHGAKPKYYHSLIGGNFRLDTVQAAVLVVKLRYLNEWHNRRQENARYYDEKLRINGVVLPQLAYKRQNHIYNQYIINVPGRRDELKDYLTKNEIGCEVYYPVPFHLQECFKNLDYKDGDFPNSERAAKNTLAIPIYPELSTKMQDHVIERIKSFYS